MWEESFENVCYNESVNGALVILCRCELVKPKTCTVFDMTLAEKKPRMLVTPSALSMRMLKLVVLDNSSRASLSSVTLRSITCDPRFTPPQVSFSMREYRSFVLCERPARSDITSEIEAQKVVLRALVWATSIPMSSGVAMIWRGIGMRNAVGGSETTGSNDNLISHAVK